MPARTNQVVDLKLDHDGAQLFAQALDEAACISLETALAELPTSLARVRIPDGVRMRPFIDAAGPIGAIAVAALGSLAANPPRRRRVLQIYYSADSAPGPLIWRGV